MAKTPGSVGSKKNTLFNYFTKTPPVGNLQSPKQYPQSASSKKSLYQKLDLKFAAGDLVWAKMEGHPWWPSLVFDHPKDGDTRRKKGSSYLVNVQFFGKPPSRGWVKERFVKPFNGSNSKECRRGGTYFSSNQDWKIAVQEADKVLKLNTEERLQVVVAMESSDDEDNSEDKEIDDKRKDDRSPEMAESSTGGNKTDKENESPPESTPPKGQKRSTRRPQNKKRRVVESNDEDDCFSPEDSYQPGANPSSSSSSEEESVVEEEDDDDKMSCDDEDSPRDRKRKRNGESKSTKKEKSAKEGATRNESIKTFSKKKEIVPTTPLTPKSSEFEVSVKSKLSAYSASSSVKVSSSSSAPAAPPLMSDDNDRNFPHTSFKFLQPDKIKDASRISVDDPDYDPRTLYVPDDFLSKQTPAMKQWWVLKSQYYDTILFFKMGKFYELFHMDAVIGVNVLGLLFMKGEHAHCGFPEISYGRFSDILIQKGYKVGRVEQTETPDQMQERCKQSKSGSKLDKVVKREVCSVQSRGTKKSSFIDGDCCSADHNFLLAISEKADSSESVYGVCFVDVMIGKFNVGQFKDDRHGSRLRTLISHFPPSQVLYEKGKLSEKTRSIFNSCLSQSIKEGLKSGVEFWDGSKTLKMLSEADYFVVDGNQGPKLPRMFDEMISEEDSLGLTPSENFSLGLSALGAIVWYLRHCLMDDELLSLGLFEIYTPLDVTPESQDDIDRSESSLVTNKKMILDGVTLVNLDVLINSCTGSSEGTLLRKLDTCRTSFGKRLFKQWLCSPLCSVDSINDRLNAVEDIMSVPDVVSKVSASLSKLPDLERLLNKIHTLSLSRRSQNHPDSRAVFFEDVIYNKRKIEDFITCMEGFKSAMSIVEKFEDVSGSFKSKLLKRCITLKESKGMFPNLTKQLKFFDASFDHQEAKKKGVIKPAKGVNEDYDDALNDIGTCEEELNECLEQLNKLLNCKTLTYFGTAKNRYQVEVPDQASRRMPDEYELTSQRKGFKRYQNGRMRTIFGRLVDAEERRNAAQKDTMRCIFEQFDKHHTLWTEALHCLCVLDILLTLANYSNQSGMAMCRPELVSYGDKSFLEIRNGCHPCVEGNVSGSDFIPNDTLIGAVGDDSADSHVLLVTGPNMGGKSTLMRQVGLICILAQLGCYVPAEKCRLSPVDRIFTRLGASDRIMSGESTFFVELSETSCVLRHATKNSLVLLDELGRGTATYDGNAIAAAVLQELADSIRCRTIFSTHYHSIVDKFSSNHRVTLGHMACMVENEDDDDPCQERITFLFKLAPGNCPKSYGFNAAKLAGISTQIIREAHLKAKEFEESMRTIQLFRNLWSIKEDERDQLKLLIAEINN